MAHHLAAAQWPQLHVHEQTAQLRCLMTTLCDKNCQPSDWVFTADRVNRYAASPFSTHLSSYILLN